MSTTTTKERLSSSRSTRDILLLFSLVAVLSLSVVTSAPGEPLRPLESGTVLMYSPDMTRFWVLDPETWERTPYLDLERSDVVIRDFRIGQNSHYIYTVEATARLKLKPDDEIVRIVQTDLVTLERQVIFEKENIAHVFSYSDTDHLLVQYYPVGSPDIRLGTNLCILDLESIECNDLTRGVVYSFLSANQVHWVGDGQFVASGNSWPFAFVDVNTQEIQLLLGEWDGLAAALHPETNTFLLATLYR